MFKNRLANESSPYLLQHAHNPVDWYPWGDEAIKKARDEDKPMLEAIQRRMKGREFWSMKPILLSVDGAAVFSRRILKQMIDEEQKESSVAA